MAHTNVQTSTTSINHCHHHRNSNDKNVKTTYEEYIKIDRDKATFKSHRDFDSEIEMTFKHF